MNHAVYSITPLPDLAVIEAKGPDSAGFLHGQLSNDINGLAEGQACLAAYCTPKGRMLASLVIWKVANEPEPVFRALIKSDIAPAIVKRLSMFVLRAKTKLTLTDLVVHGVMAEPNPDGPAPQDITAVLAGLPAGSPTCNYQALAGANGNFIAAPSAQGPGRWWFVSAPGVVDCAERTPPDAQTDAAQNRWHTADIAAGLAWIQHATQELFIPQTLNFDLVGGVSFTKGCYPGQEVVARSHYRGTVKRRMARGVIDSVLPNAAGLAGQDTFDARHPDAAVGRVVNVATLAGQTHLLLEVQLADRNTADLRVLSADGPAITLVELPYSIDPDA